MGFPLSGNSARMISSIRLIFLFNLIALNLVVMWKTRMTWGGPALLEGSSPQTNCLIKRLESNHVGRPGGGWNGCVGGAKPGSTFHIGHTRRLCTQQLAGHSGAAGRGAGSLCFCTQHLAGLRAGAQACCASAHMQQLAGLLAGAQARCASANITCTKC